MRVYADHDACTPVEPAVLSRFLEVERDAPANPGSLHTSGRRARASIEDARDDVAAALGVASDEVYFVASGTEANNIAVRTSGIPEYAVLLAPVEHPSVFEAARRRGHVLWSVDRDGHAIPEPPSAADDQRVGLVCLTHAQNELGTIQPIGAAADVAAEIGVPLHVDAAQTLGRLPLDEVLARATSVAFSTHKAGGLRGGSILVARADARAQPIAWGGGQERGLRPGTPSPALCVTSALALRLAVEQQVERARAMRERITTFRAALDARVALRCLTPGDALPNTLMLLFERVDGRNLLPALDLAGVEASQGSACSSGSPTPPAILRSIGLDDDDARRCVRFSFSHETREDSVVFAARTVSQVVLHLQGIT